jgi:hypothetical protein
MEKNGAQPTFLKMGGPVKPAGYKLERRVRLVCCAQRLSLRGLGTSILQNFYLYKNLLPKSTAHKQSKRASSRCHRATSPHGK